jgi:hypothetical protein
MTWLNFAAKPSIFQFRCRVYDEKAQGIQLTEVEAALAMFIIGGNARLNIHRRNCGIAVTGRGRNSP